MEEGQKQVQENKKEDKEVLKGFLRFMRASDGHSENVSKLLKCHLLTEYYLDQIIVTGMNRGDLLLEKGRFRFTDKLIIVRSLGVISDRVLTAIKHLNTVRNNCSHQLDYEITESDIDLFGRPFGKEYSKDKKKHSDDSAELINAVLISIISRLDKLYETIVTKKD